MTTSGELTRRVHESFESSKQFTGLPLVLEPVPNLLSITIVSDDIGDPQLGEVPAYGLDRPSRRFGQLARSQGTTVR